MDKYIVEIDGKNIFLDADGKNKLALSVKADNGYAVFCTEIPLTPYTEPDTEAAYAHGYSNAEIKYRAEVKEAYQKGLSDAWDCARKISSMDSKTRDEIFDRVITSNIVDENTAFEAIEKIRQYEQNEQNEQESITVEEVMRQYLDTFCKGRICKGCPLNTPDFNFICGRGYHFITSNPISDEEVRRAYAEVIAKMKEAE